MGTDAHVVVVGGDEAALVAYARDRLADLERRWSRFTPDSELSRLNRRPGRPVVVSPETLLLVERAVAAWWGTGGRFDPTVLDAVIGAGYDRDFDELAGGVGPSPRPHVPRPAPGCSGIRVDPPVPAVWLPPGTGIDSGGIGKGLAADVVTEELLRAGAAGAMVNVGGDLRARGTPPTRSGWVVAVEAPFGGGGDLLRLAVPEGAVATSSPLRRRWRVGGGEAHHLIDPASGAPADAPLAAVTVVTAEAWWAEALATSLCIGGVPASVASRPDAAVVMVGRDGRVLASPELARWVA